jgi:hypothetical protein
MKSFSKPFGLALLCSSMLFLLSHQTPPQLPSLTWQNQDTVGYVPDNVLVMPQNFNEIPFQQFPNIVMPEQNGKPKVQLICAHPGRNQAAQAQRGNKMGIFNYGYTHLMDRYFIEGQERDNTDSDSRPPRGSRWKPLPLKRRAYFMTFMGMANEFDFFKGFMPGADNIDPFVDWYDGNNGKSFAAYLDNPAWSGVLNDRSAKMPVDLYMFDYEGYPNIKNGRGPWLKDANLVQGIPDGPALEAAYRQATVNRFVAAAYYIKKALPKDAKLICHYLLQPIFRVSKVALNDYRENPHFLWDMPANAQTPWAKARNCPPEIHGKRVRDFFDYFLLEDYGFYEDWLDDQTLIKTERGEQVFHIFGHPAKVEHFGPNDRHATANLLGNIEVNLRHFVETKAKLGVNIGLYNLSISGFWFFKNNNAPGPVQQEPWYVSKFEGQFQFTKPQVWSEQMVYIPLFTGLDLISNWNLLMAWQNTYDLLPSARNENRNARGEFENVARTLKYDSQVYFLSALDKVINHRVAVAGVPTSVMDLKDSTAIFPNQNLEVSYDGGQRFEALNAEQIRLRKLPFVRAMINTSKNAIALWGSRPYGVEMPEVVWVRWNDRGKTFLGSLKIPVKGNVLRILPLKNN